MQTKPLLVYTASLELDRTQLRRVVSMDSGGGGSQIGAKCINLSWQTEAVRLRETSGVWCAT